MTDRKQAEAERLQRLQAQAAHAIAEAKQAQAVFLADVSAALSSSLEYEQTLQKAAEVAVPYFADWCSIDLVNPDHTISRVAIAHQDPVRVKAAWAAIPNSKIQEELGVITGSELASIKSIRCCQLSKSRYFVRLRMS